MRLAILTQYYPPEMGAPQARLSELASRFVARGHQVDVLTAMPNYPAGKIFPGYGGVFKRETLDGSRITRTAIYPTKKVGLVPRLANYFSFVFSSALVGAAALPRVDYLLAESPPLFLGLSGFFLSRLKGARLIFNVADLWPQSAVELGVLRDGSALRMARRLEAFCYRRAWLVSGQSRGILADIERRFPEVPTHHLSNGVDPDLFHPDVEPQRRELGLGEDDECIVLYAGLHGLAQGLTQILEAAARLREVEKLKFVLVGDGPDKENLKARAEELGLDNVRFLDPVPRSAMPSLVASADVGIACLKRSMRGAVPSKIYESMGAGRPLVLAAEGEPAEIVNGSGAGLVVPSGDVEGLTASLRRLAKSPEE
ncbi:MAG: glycosyltransferase family 4 protein, partial [Acidobacteriota bacterium]